VAIVGAWFRVDLAMLRMPTARVDSATAGMRMHWGDPAAHRGRGGQL